MGRNSSKPEPPLLNEPWREINWSDRHEDLEYLKNYKPQTEGQQMRVLLHGLSGAGKSSFINSIQSVLNGRIYRQALADNNFGSAFTKKYSTFQVRKQSNTFYPFVFNDIMGLESTNGVLVEDVELALKGHIKDGYQFNPLSKLSEDDQFYNKSPNFNDKVHVLVLVIGADTSAIIKDESIRKVHKIRATASDLGIPQVAILTKIDKAFAELKTELKNVYKVQWLKEKMEKVSVDMGIPMNCIFAMKNYHEEINLDDNIDSLILSTLRHIISCGDDYFNFLRNQDGLRDGCV